MTVKTIVDEDFSNYCKPSMLIGTPRCTMKCGAEYCQNNPLLKVPDKQINDNEIIQRYLDNNLTHTIVFGGLDPLDSIFQLGLFIVEFREKSDDNIVIYTGYNKHEIENEVKYLALCAKKNLIMKFGRYVPNQEPHEDEILGVKLASDNQYAERIC